MVVVTCLGVKVHVGCETFRRGKPVVFRDDRRGGIEEIIYIAVKFRRAGSDSVSGKRSDRINRHRITETNAFGPCSAVMRVPLRPYIALTSDPHVDRIGVWVDVRDDIVLFYRYRITPEYRDKVSYLAAVSVEIETQILARILLDNNTLYLVCVGKNRFEFNFHFEIDVKCVLHYPCRVVPGGPYIMSRTAWYR